MATKTKKKTTANRRPPTAKKRQAPSRKKPAAPKVVRNKTGDRRPATAKTANVTDVTNVTAKPPAVISQQSTVDLVKCRFCGAPIPKPEGTVYECPKCENKTGTFKNPFVRE